MSRVRRMLAFRTLLQRVETLEDLARQAQRDEQRTLAIERAVVQHGAMIDDLATGRRLRARVGAVTADVHARVALITSVDDDISRDYVCAAPAGAAVHPGWFDLAADELDRFPGAVAVHGEAVQFVDGAWVWSYVPDLARREPHQLAEVEDAVPAASLVVRARALELLRRSPGVPVLRLLAEAGPLIALPFPAVVVGPST